MSCEHCWERKEFNQSVDDELGYVTALRIAERDGWPCTKDDENGRRLRAGQYWDEATKRDSRQTPRTD